MCMIFLIFTSE